MIGMFAGILCLIAGIFIFWGIRKEFLALLQKHHLPWRAIIKHLSLQEELAAEKHTITRFYFSWILLTLAPCFYIAGLTWATDYSFLIILFPLVWYYYLIRFFFWEKEDLKESKKNQTKA